MLCGASLNLGAYVKHQPVKPEMRQDLAWWHIFLPYFNGFSVIKPPDWLFTNLRFTTDVCMVRGGARCREKCLTQEHSRILFFLSRVTFQLLNSSRSLLLWSSGLLFCKTSGPFSAPVTTRRRYRGQFRVHQGSSPATVFATIVVYFSTSRFWTARSAHSRRSQLVCRCLKPLAHLPLPSQDSRTFYRARDQLFLSTATQRLHLFWCWLTLYFHSFLSVRVSCPCSFFSCLYAASSPSRLCWIYS